MLQYSWPFEPDVTFGVVTIMGSAFGNKHRVIHRTGQQLHLPQDLTHRDPHHCVSSSSPSNQFFRGEVAPAKGHQSQVSRTVCPA